VQFFSYTSTSTSTVTVTISATISAAVIVVQAVNRALAETLRRHFQMAEEQGRVWTALNKYSARLEMLGHSVSLLLRDQAAQARGDNSSSSSGSSSDSSCGSAGASEGGSSSLPVIALITPATSHGTAATALADLPLLRALLPSLYATMSAAFEYRVYLVANEGDKVYGDRAIVQLIFEMAAEAWGQGQTHRVVVSHELVLVPDSMTPKYALSGLFNHGTLRAYYAGADFFYLVNDDLLLISRGWTEVFTGALMGNPLRAGLGVAGGADVSDAITPQVEFPFFHRTHVSSSIA
jgi:hypothetical protein